MKKYVSLILSFFFSLTMLNAQTFEGIVNFKSSGGGKENGAFKYYGKGNKIKMEMISNEMGAVIFDGNKTTILVPSQKSYMEFSNEMMNSFGDMMPGEEEELDASDLPIKTSETKDILGYTCTKWVYNDGDSKTEIWITDKLGNYIIPSTPMTPAPEWAKLFDGKPFFPLLIVTIDNGVETDRMEVTKIEKKSLSDSEFSPPADYKKIDIGSMMGK